MKTMIIFLAFVPQGAAQMLFAQNLTIEIRGIEKVEGHLYEEAHGSLSGNSERQDTFHPLSRIARRRTRNAVLFSLKTRF